MASDVQRRYLMQPNPFIWDHDFAQMHDNGINMIRTDLWTAWDQVMKSRAWCGIRTAQSRSLPAHRAAPTFPCNSPSSPHPRQFRRATPTRPRVRSSPAGPHRRHRLSLQRRPFLMWDLINEPSFDKTAHLWVTRANGDRFESLRWNDYLTKTYGTNDAAANAWNITRLALPVPDELIFPGSVYRGGHRYRRMTSTCSRSSSSSNGRKPCGKPSAPPTATAHHRRARRRRRHRSPQHFVPVDAGFHNQPQLVAQRCASLGLARRRKL